MRRRRLAVTILAAVLVSSAFVIQAGGPDGTPGHDKPLAQSVARADLLACHDNNAKVLEPSDASGEELARALNGIWMNRNGRTVNGRLVESDTVLYIQMNGLEGTGILLDRNNLGLDTLTAPFVNPRRNRSLPRRTRRKLSVRPQQPLALRQVNCTYKMRDEYIKVSGEMLIEVVAATTPIRRTKGLDLEGAWEQLKEVGYFEALDMPPVDQAGRVVRTSAGKVPGAEYRMPMQAGGFFRITISERENGPGGYQSVHLYMDAEYAGTGINSLPGEAVKSSEESEFVMDGDAFVSARGVKSLESAETARCDEENDLECDSNDPSSPDIASAATGPTGLIGPPGSSGSTASSNSTDPSDPTGASEDLVGSGLTHTTDFYFERVVIGMP